MARATWAQWPLRGSLWVVKYLCCHRRITQTHPRGDTTVREKVDFSKFFSQCMLGSKLLCVLWALCVDSHPGLKKFFLVHGPSLEPCKN